MDKTRYIEKNINRLRIMHDQYLKKMGMSKTEWDNLSALGYAKEILEEMLKLQKIYPERDLYTILFQVRMQEALWGKR